MKKKPRDLLTKRRQEGWLMKRLRRKQKKRRLQGLKLKDLPLKKRPRDLLTKRKLKD